MPLKTCPNCGNQVGPRTYTCSCGHQFGVSPSAGTTTAAASTTTTLAPVKVSAVDLTAYVVTAPAGKPIVAYNDDLEEWVRATLEKAAPKRYSSVAFRYWLRMYYHLSEDQLSEATPWLRQLCGEVEAPAHDEETGEIYEEEEIDE